MGEVGVDKKSGSEGRQVEVRVQKGTVGEGKRERREELCFSSNLLVLC